MLEIICLSQRTAVSIYPKWFPESGIFFFPPSEVQQLELRDALCGLIIATKVHKEFLNKDFASSFGGLS